MNSTIDPGGVTLTSQRVEPKHIFVVGLGLAGAVMGILALAIRETVLVPVGMVACGVSLLLATSMWPAHQLRTVARVLVSLGIALALVSILLVVWD